MTWFLSAFLILCVGCSRLADGSSLKYPRFATTALNALLISLTAWIASGSLIASVIVGICSAATIQSGYTSWTKLLHQVSRGIIGFIGLLLCLAIAQSLTPLGISLSPWHLLLMCWLHIIAFAQYWLGSELNAWAQVKYKDKPEQMPWLLNHWEVPMRFTQGAFICSAATLL